MQINPSAIEKRVREKLQNIGYQSSSAAGLIALQKLLKTEMQRLYLRHRFGIPGSQIVAARSVVVDLLIQQLARTGL